MYINLDRKLWKSLTAEFVGCFFLNFFGCGACVASNCYGFGPADDSQTHLPAGDIALCAAFAFGGVIVVNIVIIGPVSGCQINPAVTIGFMTVGMMPIPRGLLYIVVQVLGCLAGTGALSTLIPYRWWTLHIAPNLLNESKGVDIGKGFAYEMLMTFVLMAVVLAVTDDRRPEPHPHVALVIGVTVGAAVFCGVFATGTSMNPARTLGSAIVSEEYTNVWVYCTAPTLGAVLAAQGYHWVLKDRKKPGEIAG
ncbi:Aquaporin [Gryllus bimaculatus]|nr:Aquaporin [Gryllus bimaculatus]